MFTLTSIPHCQLAGCRNSYWLHEENRAVDQLLSSFAVNCFRTSKTTTMISNGNERRLYQDRKPFQICCFLIRMDQFSRSTKVDGRIYFLMLVWHCTNIVHKQINNIPVFITRSLCRFVGAEQSISENTQNSSDDWRHPTVGVSKTKVIRKFCKFNSVSDRTAHLWFSRIREECWVIPHNQVCVAYELLFPDNFIQTNLFFFFILESRPTPTSQPRTAMYHRNCRTQQTAHFTDSRAYSTVSLPWMSEMSVELLGIKGEVDRKLF